MNDRQDDRLFPTSFKLDLNYTHFGHGDPKSQLPKS